METLLLITILALMVLMLLLATCFLFVFARIMGVELSFSFRSRENKVTEDKTNEVPLFQFKPDFKKPLKVTYNDNDLVDDTEDKITPLSK
jgi:hypothetical protein